MAAVKPEWRSVLKKTVPIAATPTAPPDKSDDPDASTGIRIIVGPLPAENSGWMSTITGLPARSYQQSRQSRRGSQVRPGRTLLNAGDGNQFTVAVPAG